VTDTNILAITFDLSSLALIAAVRQSRRTVTYAEGYCLTKLSKCSDCALRAPEVALGVVHLSGLRYHRASSLTPRLVVLVVEDWGQLVHC